MINELVFDFHSLSNDVEQMRIVLQTMSESHWWNTQWFSSLIGAIVGAVAALAVGLSRDYFSLRRKKLENWYSHIVERQQPEHLFTMASITRYGHTSIRNGRTEVVSEKPFSERVLIEFRKNYKHWNLPISHLRFLFWRYEKSLKNLPDLNSHQIEESPQYLKAKNIFNKIIKISEKKTGESQWTIRDPNV